MIVPFVLHVLGESGSLQYGVRDQILHHTSQFSIIWTFCRFIFKIISIVKRLPAVPNRFWDIFSFHLRGYCFHITYLCIVLNFFLNKMILYGTIIAVYIPIKSPLFKKIKKISHELILQKFKMNKFIKNDS